MISLRSSWARSRKGSKYGENVSSIHLSSDSRLFEYCFPGLPDDVSLEIVQAGHPVIVRTTMTNSSGASVYVSKPEDDPGE